MHVERALKGTPNCDAVFVAVLGNYSIVFDVEMFLGPGAVFTLDDVSGLRPCRIHVALLKQKAFEQIVRAPHDRLLVFALFNGENGWKQLVFNPHRVHGLRDLVFVRMSKEQDRFVAVINLSIGKAGLVGIDELDLVFARNICRCD